MADSYFYLVEAVSEPQAQYVASLLRLHGLTYPWDVAVQSDFGNNDVRVCVGRAGRRRDTLSAELIFSENPAFLTRYGIVARQEDASGVTHIAFLDADLAHLVTFSVTWPMRVTDFTFDRDWTVRAHLICNSGKMIPLLVQPARRQLVFCGALIPLIDSAVFGPLGVAGTFEDWAEAYGSQTSQAMALACPLERLFRFLRDTLTEIAPEALPAVVGYFPPGRTAPLLVTGDTDDATPEQLSHFFTAVERSGGRASVLVRSFQDSLTPGLHGAAIRDHGIGIHPYSRDGSPNRFETDFRELTRQCNAFTLGQIGGVRNHRFQWTTRTQSVALARAEDVGFDLNCVAASGQSWIGSGSGIAFPVPFPPLAGHAFVAFPLHLPTIIEDDVYLYDYDYCYTPHHSGDSAPEDLLMRFLDDWLLDRQWPVVANLHPEHVDPPRDIVMRAVLAWASRAAVWMPTLEVFRTWIEARLSCRFDVVGPGTIGISSPVPVVLRPSRGLTKCGDGLRVSVGGEGHMVLNSMGRRGSL